MSIINRIKPHARSPQVGILLLVSAISITFAWVQLAGGPGSAAGTHVTRDPSTGVEFQARFSQPLIVQGEDGTIYLDLSVSTPKRMSLTPAGTAGDLVLVLDRSGSMAEGNKWQFATEAVRSLLARLGPEDRISLVTFDTRGRLETPLVSASPANLGRLRRLVDALTPGEHTNMGEGLLIAENLFRESRLSERPRRIVLLSDGHANHGIVNPAQLSRITARIADRGVIVSTVGMGLGFNEVLMASLADHGMGSFNFLESLETLATILADELSHSRQVFAEGSEIRIKLPAGIELRDTAGYPHSMEGRTAVVRTGQLLENHSKRLMLTLKVDTRQPADFNLERVGLHYRMNGREYQQLIASKNLKVACVAPERKLEATESIDKEVFRQAWIRNNLGSVMNRVAEYLREGDEDQAKAIVGDYRFRLEEAEAAAPGLLDEASAELKKLEARVDDAFKGRDQKIKQNRAAKELLGAGQRMQREVQKKQ